MQFGLELNHKMNRYKAMNLAKNEEIRLNRNTNNFKIEKKKLSSGLICWLFKNYYLDEWITDNHCCYGEDFCCWQEDHSSWMSLIYHSNKVLQQEIYRIFQRKVQKYKEINCYLVSYEWNNNKIVKLIIPLQDRTFQKDIEKLSFSVV